MGKELMPCPFCGGEVEEEIGLVLGERQFYCLNCGARTIFVAEDGVVAKCREAWNRRTECKKENS